MQRHLYGNQWQDDINLANAILKTGNKEGALNQYQQILTTFTDANELVMTLCTDCLVKYMDRYIITCLNMADCSLMINRSNELISCYYMPLGTFSYVWKRQDLRSKVFHSLMHRYNYCMVHYKEYLKYADEKLAIGLIKMIEKRTLPKFNFETMQV